MRFHALLLAASLVIFAIACQDDQWPQQSGRHLCDWEIRPDQSFTLSCENYAEASVEVPTAVPDVTPDVTPPPTSQNKDGSTREKAFPFGAVVALDVFDVQITAADSDAWPEVKAANQFNDPPADGNRMLMLSMSVTNERGPAGTVCQCRRTNEDGSCDRRYDPPEICHVGSYFNDSDLVLWDSSDNTYQSFREDVSCGVLPDQLGHDLYSRFESVRLPSGESMIGNVCWQVPADEEGFVVQYDDPYGTDVWLVAANDPL
ncbi:MAG: hypothetical protein F4X64_17225 [Chloroflexi bacterium]|nr:hypothetical protein [Chloroflexota bacterium]